MAKAMYTKILSCLHPDRVDGDVLKRRFEQVFHLFKDMEMLLVAEAEKASTGMEVPDSVEGLMALRKGRSEGEVRMVGGGVEHPTNRSWCRARGQRR
jgi:hypothetical protein